MIHSVKPLAAFSVEFHCSDWEEVKALLNIDQFLLALALLVALDLDGHVTLCKDSLRPGD